MSTLLLAALVTILPWYEDQPAQPAPSRVKVFLAASPGLRVQKDCFGLLATSLTAQIAATKTVVPARSAADADVIVRVKECRTVDTPQLGGEVHVSSTIGGPGRDVQGGSSVGVGGQHTSVSRVVLVVDDHGTPKEFSPDSKDLQLSEAAQSATASLLTWIQKAQVN